MLRACQDPEIQRRIPIPVPYQEADAIGFVTTYAEDRWASRAGAPFAVADAASDELLGSCGLVSVDAGNLVGEMGYWVAPWARRRGVALRAARLLADFALSRGGLERVEFYVEPGNIASCRVAERLGCQQEGVLRRKALIAGKRRDMILYALLRPREIVRTRDPERADVPLGRD